MSYIGSPPSTQSFAPGTDTFSGDGTTVAFTLSRNVGTVNDILVVVNNVDQQPTAYTVSVSTLTFTAAPSSGTNNIYVRYLSTNLNSYIPQAGSVGKQSLDVGNSDGTGAAIMPGGTTAQRPSIPLNGMYRLNTTTGSPEWYSSALSSWIPFSSAQYLIEYLVVAGGASGGAGSGGFGPGGGGGAGGYLASTASVSVQTAYTVTIGAGGASTAGPGGTGAANPGSNGSNSVVSTVATATGGGAGGAASSSANGGAGGSGGGAGGNFSFNGVGGSATSGQGNAGVSATSQYNSGGGGGAAAAGSGTAGGAGANWQSLGTFYAGGGGGALNSSTGGAGGAGGGGAGGTSGAAGTAGTANTGGGGGGGGNSGSGAASGAGGSGIVIIRYLGAQRGTGGTYSSSGGYSYHVFTTSGTYTA